MIDIEQARKEFESRFSPAQREKMIKAMTECSTAESTLVTQEGWTPAEQLLIMMAVEAHMNWYQDTGAPIGSPVMTRALKTLTRILETAQKVLSEATSN